MEVNRIVEDETRSREVIRRTWEKKVPLMQDIVGMGLEMLRDTLKECVLDSEMRRQMIGNSVKDLAALTKVVGDLNLLLRLEEGKSTQNVAVNKSYQDTRHALQTLAKVDPVFSYPIVETIPAPEDDSEKS